MGRRQLTEADWVLMLTGCGVTLGGVPHVLCTDGRALLPRICDEFGMSVGMLWNAPLVDREGRPFTECAPVDDEGFDELWSVPPNQTFARQHGFKEDNENFCILPLGGVSGLVKEFWAWQTPGGDTDYCDLLGWCLECHDRAPWLAVPLEAHDFEPLLVLSRDRALLTRVHEIASELGFGLLSSWTGRAAS